MAVSTRDPGTDRTRRTTWDRRVRHMEELADSPGFRWLRAQIIAAARLECTERVLDIGAGTGLLTLAAASKVAHVTAVDTSSAMCRHLERELGHRSIDNASVIEGNACRLPVADRSMDVVVSNYCFHHLKDDDKRRALSEAIRVLRPNGRFVIADMMFQIGLRQARDRSVIVHFVAGMLRRGPAGVVRLAKNVLRLATGAGEHPAGVDWWRQALDQAGFTEIDVRALPNEGGIATAVKQATDSISLQPRRPAGA